MCDSVLIGKMLHKQIFFFLFLELMNYSEFITEVCWTCCSNQHFSPKGRLLLRKEVTARPSARITSLHVLFKRDWIRFWVQGGQSWADGHQAIGCWVTTEGGIRPQMGCYWTLSRADAFPSAICLLHLKDNPLEIPPQMLATEESTL